MRVNVTELPDLVTRVLRAARDARDGADADAPELFARLSRAPAPGADALLGRLFPYQREGVRFGLSRGGRVLIGDEMGLGKTLQVVRVFVWGVWGCARAVLLLLALLNSFHHIITPPTQKQTNNQNKHNTNYKAISLLHCYRDEWPALIVAPTSLR